MTILLKVVRYHFDGQLSQRLNVTLAVLGLVLNNVVFFAGLYLLVFSNGGLQQATYYAVLSTMMLLMSGILHTFMPGLRELGSYIECSKLDEVMAYPIHPLIYLAFSSVNIAFVGDLIQGIAMLGLMFVWLGAMAALKIVALAAVSLVAFVGVYILAGSLAFFTERGGTASSLVGEITLTLSLFPIREVLTGRFGILKYVTPALITAILPMEAFESDFLLLFPVALVAAVGLVGLGLTTFTLGLRHYVPSSHSEMKS